MPGEIIPELDVSRLEVSVSFYRNVIGAQIAYERPEERFVFLDIEGASLMLEEAEGPGRRFRTAPLEYPYGRGINLQIRVADAGRLYAQACQSGASIIVPLEEKWYRRGEQELGNQQFVVADPDGYLLRLYSDLGVRSCK